MVARIADHDFARQIEGYGLSTVQIHYFMPDHPSLLQAFVMQQYDALYQPYEPPAAADLTLDTSALSVETCVERIVAGLGRWLTEERDGSGQ